jgi:hypothetical protein
MASTLERWQQVAALPPAVPDATLDEIAAMLHRRIDRDEAEARHARRRAAAAGDLSSFDSLPAPLRAIASVRFDNALAAGLASATVRMTASTTAAPIA